MSRIGRMPVVVPAGVTVTVAEGNAVTVKGPKGTLSQSFNSALTIEQKGNEIVISRPDDEKETRSLHGLTRAMIHNMVVGVTEGYSKTLEIVGVGYKAVKNGKNLQLFLGHSLLENGVPQAKYIISENDDIQFDVPNSSTIVIKGIDKQKVGQMAAVIRSKRPPEPYHGKGVKYQNEHIRRKAGKTGK